MTRILVVEDEPGIAMALEDDLRSEGYEVEVVGDGITASRRLREEDFDLVLLDIMLPEKDGFEVCREMRQAGVQTPVIMLTAKSQETEKVMGLDIGADDYVTKPYSPEELRARVRALLRRATGEHPDIYHFDDVEVDFTRCEVRRSGKLLDVTQLEFRVLGAFIRHRGCVMTRQQLLNEAWGEGVFITDRVVDNQVTNLRKKIEPEPSEPHYLVSVRGIGYRFDG
jgi:DNA-binding response OmpR family regulator